MSKMSSSAADEILRASKSVLVIDFPSRDVPESLARAGLAVTVHGGPEPDNYAIFELCHGGQVNPHRTGRPPESADLVYTHRPLGELGGIIAQARALGARALWLQSGRRPGGDLDPTGTWLPEEDSQAARRLVEAAGLIYIDDVYICTAAQNRG